ncbi:MAG: hypothetical protein AB7V13_22220 [Pseudorhodoplanes sp.]|uniref:hypothetical protein n=1 Tax=Pseudorhodoplanes sp. TaxID=1934341 RepID=UPI003D0A13DA
MHALDGVRLELLRLKWHVAALRFLLAMRKHAIALKAGFNPDQPRDELGQWTDAGGGTLDDGDAADGEVLDSDLGELESTDFSDVRRRPPNLPPIETLHSIPGTQPKTQQERNYIAQEVARNVRLASEYLSEVATSASHWLNEKYWEIRSFQDAPKSLGELHDGVFQADKRGYDVHHIVEQTQARNDGFPDSVINRSDNLVLIPRYRHWQINSWFETPNETYGGLTPRKYLQGKSWDEKRYIGLGALQKFEVLKP